MIRVGNGAIGPADTATFVRVNAATSHYLPIMLVAPFLSLSPPRFRPIRDAVFYRLSSVHQLFMATQRRALKERAHRTAPFVECHDDFGRPVLAFVRVCDGASTLTEGASMTFERFTAHVRPSSIDSCPPSFPHAARAGNQEHACN